MSEQLPRGAQQGREPVTPSTEPATRAGDDLLTDLINDHEAPSYHVIERVRHGILDIEREAAAPLAAEVTGLRNGIRNAIHLPSRTDIGYALERLLAASSMSVSEAADRAAGPLDAERWQDSIVCYCVRRHSEPCWGHRHRWVPPGDELGHVRCEPHGHYARLAAAEGEPKP